MKELISFLEGHEFDFEPQLTGKIERFDRDGELNAWFVGKEFDRKDGTPFIVASFGDWRTDEKYTFSPDNDYTKEEARDIKRKLSVQRKEMESERERIQEVAATNALATWTGATKSVELPAYLAKKGLRLLYGCRAKENQWGYTDLLVPMYDVKGKLWGIQKIQNDGKKFFTPGQRKSSCFYLLDNKDAQTIFIVEGFSTGASVFESGLGSVVIAFDAGNLESVTRVIKRKYPQRTIIICGDDDRFNPKVNVGRVKAEKCSSLFRVHFVLPSFKRLDTKPTDFNDLHVTEGIEEVKKQLIAAVKKSKDPVIPTEHCGFHKEEWKNGNVIHVPSYEDLRLYFERKHPYKILGESSFCMVWDGKKYVDLSNLHIEHFAQRHFRPFADNHKAREFRGIVMRNNLEKVEWFNNTSHKKVNFQNGYMDLETEQFHKGHFPHIGFRYVLDYDYNPDAKCPVFDKMLQEVTCNDEALAKIILEAMGYAISNDSYWVHKAVVFVGEGENGKSTLMNVLKEAAGAENHTSLTLRDLNKETNRQLLDGKLFNMAGETPTRSLEDSSIFKALSSGEDIAVRQLYKTPYMLANRAKLFFACNGLPSSLDTSRGFFRRFLIIPFNAVFKRGGSGFDPFINKKLTKELPGIFNRILEGYHRLWKQSGFTNSKSSDDALKEYEEYVDFTRTWIEEKIEITESDPEKFGNGTAAMWLPEIHQSYITDMEAELFKPVNAKSFGKKLSQVIPMYQKRTHVGWDKQAKQHRRAVHGIMFRGENEKF